ncbi:hypothetical protein F5X99DRAFT_392891 [Biscogniauxia marginata]|nr:hypothetical protein F5X99DRAFT_392891 [Biscogniauxia marginata]
MDGPSGLDVETDDDDPKSPRHDLSSSSHIPTPPSDGNRSDSVQPPSSMSQGHNDFNSLLRLNHNPVSSPIPQRRSPCSIATHQSPCSDYAEAEDTADILISLRFARVKSRVSAYRPSKKRSLSLQASASDRSLDSNGTRSCCASPPDSLVSDDSPSLKRVKIYDSDETEILDEIPNAFTSVPVGKQPPQPRPNLQRYTQGPPTRCSMRLQINQETKNLKSNMNTSSTSPSLNPKSKEDATWIAGLQQAARDLEHRAGGPPKSDSKEDQQRFERSYLRAFLRRGEEKPWTQLEQAQRFVENMSRDTFEYPRKNKDYKESCPVGMKGYLRLDEQVLRSQPSRDVPRHERNLRRKRSKLTAQITNSKLNQDKKITQKTTSAPPQEEETLKAVADPSGPHPDLEATSPQLASTPPRKKRRTVADKLASDLGEKWKAHVDEHGHRPTRKSVKKV